MSGYWNQDAVDDARIWAAEDDRHQIEVEPVDEHDLDVASDDYEAQFWGRSA